MIDPTPTASHEAAHIACGWALGLQITGPATIAPKGRISGRCHVGRTLQPGNGCRPPTPLLYRAEVEADAITALAGQHGAWQAPSITPDTPPTPAARRFTERVVEQAAHARHPSDPGNPEPPDDYDYALDLLLAYHGPQRAHLARMHLDLLDAEAAALVSTPMIRQAIRAIAAELLDHEQVDATRLIELCEQNVAKPLLSQWNQSAILKLTT